MSTQDLNQVTRLIESRLSALLARPNMWGTPDAVELQFLLLVELRHAAAGASSELVDLVLERYRQHLRDELGESPRSLAEHLGLKDRSSPEFIRILTQFERIERFMGTPEPSFQGAWTERFDGSSQPNRLAN